MKTHMKKISVIMLSLCLMVCGISPKVNAAGNERLQGILFENLQLENNEGISKEFTCFSSKSRVYVKNGVTGYITPTNAGFDIGINNSSSDKIDYLTFTLKLYDVKGNYIAETSKSFSNLNTGVTTWTWYRAKSNTVQETINMDGSGQDDGQNFSFSTSTLRYNFVGGSYGSMAALGGERHHIPSDSINGLATTKGPCIRMVTAEHRRTASCGSSSSAIAFRNKEASYVQQGQYTTAMNLGIQDVRNLYGSKYDTAIQEMVNYANSIGYRG